jgi:hypothetical protein
MHFDITGSRRSPGPVHSDDLFSNSDANNERNGFGLTVGRGSSSADIDEADAWAVRHGSVGQWLQDVAAPMERKLFHDFIALLEKVRAMNNCSYLAELRLLERFELSVALALSSYSCYCLAEKPYMLQCLLEVVRGSKSEEQMMRDLEVVESVSCALRNLSVAEDMRTCRSLRAKALPQWAMLIAQHDSEPASYSARAYSLSLCDVFYTVSIASPCIAV